MPKYVCPRCGYSTAIRTHMRNHFNRQTPCTIVAEDKSIDQCYLEVLGVERKTTLKKPQNISYNPQNISYNPSNNLKNEENPSFSLKKPQNISYNPQNISYNPSIISYNTEAMLVNEEPEVIAPNTCRYCKRQYSRKDNLNRHLKICKIRDEILNGDNDSYDNSSSQSTNESSDDNKDLYTKDEVYEMLQKTKQEFVYRDTQNQTIISELRKQVEQLLRNQGSNNITYNTNIVLNAFGKENMSYISNDYIKGLISQGPITSIPQLLQHIHFNPEHQENHNIKIPNRKQAYAEIYNGSTWDITDRKQAIEDMTDKAYNLINKHYSGGNEYMNKFKDLYENGDKNLNKRITKDTEIMILNNQKIVS